MRTYTVPNAFTEEQIAADYAGDLTLMNTIIGGALAQEPDAAGAARGPLTRWMYYWGQPRATKAEAMQILGVAPPSYAANIEPGDPNPFFTFIDSLNQSGNNLVRSGDTATLSPLNDDDLSWIDFGRLAMLVGVGGELTGHTVWFEIDDVTVPCPFAPSDLLDENGDPIPQETWETWGTAGESHKPQQYGDKWYRSSNVGFTGEPLPASAWTPMVLAPVAGVRLITTQEFVAIRAALLPPMEA